MGRKIPAKKHRGVKDPLVQQAKRFESLKSKINAPPRDPDEQPVPKSLLRLFGVDKKAEERKKKKSKWKEERAGELRGREKGRGSNPVAKLKRLPGESARAFSRRITGAARALHDATDAQRYPVEEEEEEDRVWRRGRRRVGPGPGADAGGQQPSRAQRRHARLQHRKKERAEAAAAAAAASTREVRHERLPFGLTAHAPPTLSAPRLPQALRPDPSAPRPGRRDLLLTRLLSGGGGGTEGPQVRAARDQRRLDAVAAYRALKARARGIAPPATSLTRSPYILK